MDNRSRNGKLGVPQTSLLVSRPRYHSADELDRGAKSQIMVSFAYVHSRHGTMETAARRALRMNRTRRAHATAPCADVMQRLCVDAKFGVLIVAPKVQSGSGTKKLLHQAVILPNLAF